MLNEWISVKEKMPEKGERVLFRVEGFVGEGYLNINNRWIRSDLFDVEVLFETPVTHWMPMPKEPIVDTNILNNAVKKAICNPDDSIANHQFSYFDEVIGQIKTINEREIYENM